jgi:hypothetical protein
MRRLASGLAFVLCVAALGGCGEEQVAGPLDEALGYLPAEAPFAVAIDTDLSGDQYRALDGIAEKLPFGRQAKRALRDSLEDEENVDFERDIRPLLGNPFVFGGVDPRNIGRDDKEFVAAIQVADQQKLDGLLDKSGASEVGERAGATIYREKDDDTYAVKDDVLVTASSRKLLELALERRENGDGLDQDKFDQALEDLPAEALVRVYADVEGMIDADPGSRSAQKVKWVDGLRTLGLTGVAAEDELEVEFRLRTEGVSESDAPIATGEESPGVILRPGDVAVGIRDLARIVEFGEEAARAVNPDDFDDYEAGKEQISALLGVNIDEDVIAQLRGDTAVTGGPDGSLSVRAELEDPEKFEGSLERIAGVVTGLGGALGTGDLGLVKPRPGQDIYRLTDSDGRSYFFGVVDEVFVLARSADAARRLASAQPEQVPGARGSIVSSSDSADLAASALPKFPRRFGLGDDVFRRLTEPFGDSTGWLLASGDELRGSTTVEVE